MLCTFSVSVQDLYTTVDSSSAEHIRVYHSKLELIYTQPRLIYCIYS